MRPHLAQPERLGLACMLDGCSRWPGLPPLTWWTIGMLLLTNLFTIYIHFSHTLAGVVITSPTLLYLPSNPLQPHSVACTSFWIITRLLTLICWQFFVETDICVASPRPDSLMLRGLVEPAQTFTKGALDAPGQLQSIYRHREHMLAHGLTGIVCSYKSRTIWLCPYGWSMNYLIYIRPIIVWSHCFRVVCLLTILTIP